MTANPQPTPEHDASRVFTTADGKPFVAGDLLYNYYDMYPVIVGDIDAQGWFTAREFCPGGMHLRSAVLNGERVCTMATADKKGWK